MHIHAMKSIVLSSIALAISASAHAGWTQWGGNGHWYQPATTTGISWWDAESSAESQGAYLATLTSKEENDFVFSLIDHPEYWFLDGANICGPWFGGIADNLKFGWVSGEAWSYENWLGGDPGKGGPQYRTLFWSLSPTETANGWNDVDPVSGGSVVGYVMESNVNPVPEPSAVIGVLGSLGLGLMLRRSR